MVRASPDTHLHSPKHPCSPAPPSLSRIPRPLAANQSLSTFLSSTALLYSTLKLSTLSPGLPRTLLLAALSALNLLQTIAGALAAYSWAADSLAKDVYEVPLASGLGWELLLQVVGQLVASGAGAGVMVVEGRGARWVVKQEGVCEVAGRLGVETGLLGAVGVAVELGVRSAFPSSGAALACSFVVPKLFLLCMLASISRKSLIPYLPCPHSLADSLIDLLECRPGRDPLRDRRPLLFPDRLHEDFSLFLDRPSLRPPAQACQGEQRSLRDHPLGHRHARPARVRRRGGGGGGPQLALAAKGRSRAGPLLACRG